MSFVTKGQEETNFYYICTFFNEQTVITFIIWAVTHVDFLSVNLKRTKCKSYTYGTGL